MAELLLNPTDPVAKTILGGNVDIDKYIFLIEDTQIKIIEPLLGTELYDKILADKAASTLTGDYLTLFNDYITFIMRYEFVAECLTLISYELTNSGLVKKQPEGYLVVDRDETMRVAQNYSQKAQMYVDRFGDWIALNPLVEYKLNQDEVDANNNIQLIGGLWFPE